MRLGPGLVLGYHGCSEEAAARLLDGEDFEQSNQAYDRLGPGAYFWEGDWQRARVGDPTDRKPRLQKSRSRGSGHRFGYMPGFDHQEDLDLIAGYYELFKAEQEHIGAELPVNENLPSDSGGDKLLRFLDRAVISFLHEQIDEEILAIRARGEGPPIQPFDTVRGLFPEGEPAYPGAGFLRKTHTQIAVRNPACIRGVFECHVD